MTMGLLQEERAASEAPACTVTLHAPTLAQPCTSEAVHLSELGSYSPQLQAESRHELAHAGELLSKLLNGQVTIRVSADGQHVGEAQLDLLPAASAGCSSVAGRLDLRAGESGNEGLHLLPSANVTVSVSFVREPDAAGTAGEADSVATERTPTEDRAPAGKRVPFCFVPAEDDEATTVLTLKPHTISDPPSIMSSAPGGFRGCAGLVWPGGAGPARAALPVADWQVGGFAWAAQHRVFLDRVQFAALQKTVLGGQPVYLELARCARPASSLWGVKLELCSLSCVHLDGHARRAPEACCTVLKQNVRRAQNVRMLVLTLY